MQRKVAIASYLVEPLCKPSVNTCTFSSADNKPRNDVDTHNDSYEAPPVSRHTTNDGVPMHITSHHMKYKEVMEGCHLV
jgi:hypothetical protein